MYFGRFAYLVPVGFWGTRLGASVTKFSYKLGEEFASLQASGDGLVKSVYAFHPLYRTRNTNIIGQFAYEDKRLFDRIDDPHQPSVTDHFIDSHQGAASSATSATASSAEASTPSRSTYTQGDLKIAPTAAVRRRSERDDRP